MSKVDRKVGYHVSVNGSGTDYKINFDNSLSNKGIFSAKYVWHSYAVAKIALTRQKMFGILML